MPGIIVLRFTDEIVHRMPLPVYIFIGRDAGALTGIDALVRAPLAATVEPRRWAANQVSPARV